MPIKNFTFFALGRDLDQLAPSVGLTLDYSILESLIRSVVTPLPPAALREELKTLSEQHNCDFKDWADHRFVQFTKRDWCPGHPNKKQSSDLT